MHYVKIDPETDILIHYCRNCGDEITYTHGDKTICVLDANINSLKTSNVFINKYTKFDPTLPRVDNIPCPNKDCVTNTDNNVINEVIYIRTDDINMKYVYICSFCDTTWNT
jgi:aspartate carbamoyltransferase regulatory subunit